MDFKVRTPLIIAALSALFLAFLTFASGCGRYGKLSPEHPYDQKILSQKRDALADSIATLEERYYQAVGDEPATESARRVIRERIVFSLMDLIDIYQYKFNGNFYGRSTALKSSTEIISGGLSGAAAVTTPIRASQLLSAISSGVGLIGSTYDKNFIAGKTIDLVIDRMETIRQSTRARILANMKLSTAQYPLGAAILDVQEYARKGTVFAAIRAISQDNSEAANSAENEIRAATNPSEQGSGE